MISLNKYIPSDKQGHYIAGQIIAFIALIFFGALAGFFAALFAGIIKELYDKYIRKTQADILDALATAAGGFILLIASLL